MESKAIILGFSSWWYLSIALTCTPWLTPLQLFHPFAVNKFLSSVKVMNKVVSLDSAVTFLMEAEVGLCKGHFAMSITWNEIFTQSISYDKICESNLKYYFIMSALSFLNSPISVITLAFNMHLDPLPVLPWIASVVLLAFSSAEEHRQVQLDVTVSWV